jgi:hypothetical protein
MNTNSPHLLPYRYSEEELKPYFALPAVLDGLFTLCNRLYGVTIKKADGEASVWNKDVGPFPPLPSSPLPYLPLLPQSSHGWIHAQNLLTFNSLLPPCLNQ